MASQKQLDANRRNAKKSTGPRTPAGKAKSRLNAVRDGLTGQITTLSEADRPFFDQLNSEILADFKPQTAMERKLANAIAWDTWRLDHLRAIEINVYAIAAAESDDAETETAPGAFDTAYSDTATFRAEAPRFELMSLYEQRMTRNLHRNVALLRDLQAERRRNYEREEILLARFNEVNEVPIQVSTAPSKNGFIFSNEEITLAALRQRHLETAAFRLDNMSVGTKFGDLLNGFPDSFLQKVEDRRPIPDHVRNKIHGVSPESIAMRRATHPEEFGIRR
jgi:hypothetical protein